MTCKHAPGDPNCSSNNRYHPIPSDSPDSSNYEIEEVEQVGAHLILKVKYPNCRLCSYEGAKVMVFLNTTANEALRWKKIDPHFRAPSSHLRTEAPGPAARFPASSEGWQDALEYAARKVRQQG